MKFFLNSKLFSRKKWVRYDSRRVVRYKHQNWPIIFASLACLMLIVGGVFNQQGSKSSNPEGPSTTIGNLIRTKYWPITGITPLADVKALFNLRTNKLGQLNSNSQSSYSVSNTLTPNVTHQQIITTNFWVGETANASNGFIANAASAWDEQWVTNFGGVDSPSPRNGYLPAGFTPKENPFYFALPYSDYTNAGSRKSTATNCLNSSVISLVNYSWCKNTWIAISHGGKTAYAQWEDVGPYEEDDINYVFGPATPKNQQGEKAGLDVSPAVKDYLMLADVDKTNWVFIKAVDVPNGPWKQIVTTSKGSLVN